MGTELKKERQTENEEKKERYEEKEKKKRQTDGKKERKRAISTEQLPPPPSPTGKDKEDRKD